MVLSKKGESKMSKKPFTTSIDESISGEFRKACEDRGMKMNMILEAFMKQFARDEFSIQISKHGMRLDVEERGY